MSEIWCASCWTDDWVKLAPSADSGEVLFLGFPALVPQMLPIKGIRLIGLNEVIPGKWAKLAFAFGSQEFGELASAFFLLQQLSKVEKSLLWIDFQGQGSYRFTEAAAPGLRKHWENWNERLNDDDFISLEDLRVSSLIPELKGESVSRKLSMEKEPIALNPSASSQWPFCFADGETISPLQRRFYRQMSRSERRAVGDPFQDARRFLRNIEPLHESLRLGSAPTAVLRGTNAWANKLGAVQKVKRRLRKWF